ncbi:MAG: helix-turn-helix domain-containing protein [Acetobacter fabarum]|jgi:transcriptional regulator with XRE-family HTH domain|uniref:LexA family transcriptional regulator n=1 Tax=Acetobacter fabarum TaxID=483199 RepID=UPI00242E199B|nr:S24 family peptidase [Acetobacter fabarum]MCH4025020.1 helix-turn-helix domain-containing protein [Acetobacter fabarum]MCH4128600.1 helix-turn-helix domain-containing protein [Acetobacter fabarum]MCH4141811.1 helix-turn-helix domain-containing protein [Acetobacter fabarum]MCI1297626.1 helix-turn-helix domain-containing protein [Acetobacter fabarum]MCI1322987.1 helix-turn-helix domain-containing protein [Acetobacter fabarum]
MSNFPAEKKNWEVSGVPERLRDAVDKGGGYNTIVKRSGVSPSSLNEYLKGRVLRIDTAARLAFACGVSLQWLIFGTDDAESAVSGAANDDTSLIDYYDVAASAGFGMSCPDTPQPEKVSISRHFLRSELGLNPSGTIMLQVSGDSMEPTMRAGDKLIVDTERRQLLDGIHVMVASGTLLVKRLSAGMHGTVRIISDNDRYPTQEAEISRFRWGEPDGGDAITIIGRVAYRLQAMS